MEIPGSPIHQIHNLLEKKEDLEQKISEQEKLIKKDKELLRELTENLIPDLMNEMGLSEFKTKDGKTVSIEKFYSASISKDRFETASEWLRETNNDGIIKHEILVPVGRETELLEKVTAILSEAGVGFENKESVHHSTLRAFVKERIENGQPLPLDLFGVHIGTRVKVK